MRAFVMAMLSLPHVVAGWGAIVFWLTIRAAAWDYLEKGFIPVCRWRGWAANRWKYSNAFGRSVVMHPSHGDGIFQHELIHVKQSEDAGIAGLFAGLLCLFFGLSWGMGLAVWCASILFIPLGMFAAWVRGDDPYWESEFELSAYAQTARWKKGALSWREHWEAARGRNA